MGSGKWKPNRELAGANANIAFYMVAAPDKKHDLIPKKLPDYPPPAKTRLLAWTQLAARLRAFDPRLHQSKSRAAGGEAQQRSSVFRRATAIGRSAERFIAYEAADGARPQENSPLSFPKTIDDYAVSVEEHPAAESGVSSDALMAIIHYSVDRLEPRGPRHQLAPRRDDNPAGMAMAPLRGPNRPAGPPRVCSSSAISFAGLRARPEFSL